MIGAGMIGAKLRGEQDQQIKQSYRPLFRPISQSGSYVRSKGRAGIAPDIDA
jgi:hypothetical protein